MFEEIKKNVANQLTEFLQEAGIPDITDIKWTAIPFSGEWGLSTSFFQIGAQEARAGKRINVSARATELAELAAEYIGVPENFSRVAAVRGYLNLYFSPELFSRLVLEEVLSTRQDFGKGAKKDKQIMVEFSQPNTHKAFHVGHLRSAILGDAMCRILEFAGFDVVRANYLGDMGLHVIKWLWNYEKHHLGEKPLKDTTRWMGDLYAEANRRIEDNPDLDNEVRAVYARWDKQDEDMVQLWRETREWSINGFLELYAKLDIHFDRIYSNSEVEHPGKEIVNSLIKQGIAIDERPDGPVIVQLDELLGLEKETYNVLVVLRSDGTALYATEDLALALLKFKEYELDQSVYVVDVRQSLHFKQVFQTLELAGYDIVSKCHHLAYELVNLPGNVVMASREGTVVLLEELIREAIMRAKEVVEIKNPQLTEEQKNFIAEDVGIGAIKFPMLARENSKIVTFDWESALDFNGQAAPYIQYAYVRANSIIKRSEESLAEEVNLTYELADTESELIEHLSKFSDVVQRAADEKKPLHVTNYAYELAKIFNNFYNACPVLKADGDVRTFRLHLTTSVKQVLANSLNILGINAPDVM